MTVFNKEMIMVQRLRTAKEGWFWIVKILYMFIGIPFCLLVGVPSLFIASSLIAEKDFTTLGFCSLLWLGILIPVGIFAHGVLSRRRLLKRITTVIKAPQFFNPDPTNEIYHEGDGKYKGQVDILALTMSDWTNREVEGNSLFRLYTKLPDLPRIQIGTPWAQRWYDTLGAMEHKQYSTPQPFSLYVAKHVEKLERDNKIYIPKFS
jgi:hypothetical protein